MKSTITGDPPMLDITGAGLVQIQINSAPSGGILWINVDGICRLRICRITQDIHLDVPEPTDIHQYYEEEDAKRPQ